jgi:uncharacterized protein YbjQ (UPF0145 family)
LLSIFNIKQISVGEQTMSNGITPLIAQKIKEFVGEGVTSQVDRHRRDAIPSLNIIFLGWYPVDFA